MYIQPEPENFIGPGAHYVCIFTNKHEAREHRKALAADMRDDQLAGYRHRVTARKIRVEGATVTVWIVTQRRISPSAAEI